MVSARLSLSLVGVVGVMALALAGATIWLLVTQPVGLALASGLAAASALDALMTLPMGVLASAGSADHYARSSAELGLEVVRMIEAVDSSLQSSGARVDLDLAHAAAA